MKDAGVEASAFFVIVWYLHPRNRAFGFSAVMRTILTEATVYFFAMVAVHTYSIIGVRLFTWSPHRAVVVKYDSAGHRQRTEIFVSVSTQWALRATPQH